MRWRSALLSILIMMSLFFILDNDETTVAGEPSIGEGAYREFTYEKQRLDGEYTKEGVETATISYGSWTGTDCVIFSGTNVGTFSSNDHSGSFSGEYRSYYTYDLALMYRWSEITTEVDGLSVTETNESRTSYGFPFHRWISLPLSPPESWDSNVSEDKTWDLYYSDGSDESGNDAGTMDWHFLCFSTEDVTVEAGAYTTFKIMGSRQKDTPDNRSSETWYSEDVGWWVERNVWAGPSTERVLIEHYELTDVSTNSPPEVDSTPSVTMDEDGTDDSIVLSSVFSDPDGDPLTFQVSENGTLPVTLSSGKVRIAPAGNDHGTWTFTLTAMDDKGSTASVDIDVTVNPVDDRPVLSDPTVSPDIGVDTTTFTFTINMVDIDGYTSSDLRLFVDSMEYQHPDDPGSAVDGVTLSWEMSLAVGAHSHYFIIDGTREPATGDIAGPRVESSYTPWLGNPTLSLDEAGTGDQIEYGITWTYGAGSYPDSYNIYLDGSLQQMDIGDGNPETGLEFYYITTLEEGTHSYFFEARLGLERYRYPSSGELEGPVIYDPKISGSGFGPTDLEDGDDATFFAIFENGHGEAPTVHVVVLDGTEYELTASSGDIATGVNYTRTVELSEGPHSYSFRFEVEWDVLTTSTWSFDVDPVEGDDDPPPGGGIESEEEGADPFVIVLIVVLVTVIAGAIYYLFIEKRKDEDGSGDSSHPRGRNRPDDGEEWEEGEEQEDDYDRVKLHFKP